MAMDKNVFFLILKIVEETKAVLTENIAVRLQWVWTAHNPDHLFSEIQT